MNLCKTNERKIQGQEGFALIIALALMSLAVLVLISMTVLTRVETNVASNSVKLNQAQENARLALELAIGELQRHAGADGRITAPANILDANAPIDSDAPAPLLSNPVLPNNQFAHPYWTGVWEPVTPGDPSSLLRLRSWLVSGNENNPVPPAGSATIFYRPNERPDQWGADNRLPPVWTGDSSNHERNVTLVGDRSTRNAEGDENEVYNRAVVAPLRPIFARDVPGFDASDVRVVGEFAYWVGDEGVKADVSLYDRQIPNLLAVEQRLKEFMSAQRVDIRGVRGAFDNTENDYGDQFIDFRDDLSGGLPNLLPRLTDFNQVHHYMRNRPGSFNASDWLNYRIDGRKERFHDLTVGTRSLLTNPLDGRLKVDLSARNGASYPSNAGDLSLDPAAPDLSGDQLDAIFDFLENGAWTFLSAMPTASNDPDWIRPVIPLIPPTRGGNAITTGPGIPSAGAFPVITKTKASFRFYNDSGFIHLDGAFVIELWNPYSHAIDLQNANLEVVFDNLPAVTVVTTPGIGPYTAELSDIFDDLPFRVDFTGVMEPGQVLVFSGGGGETLAQVTTPENLPWSNTPYTHQTNQAAPPDAGDGTIPEVTAVTIVGPIDPQVSVTLFGHDATNARQHLQEHIVNYTVSGSPISIADENEYQFAFYHGLGDENVGLEIFNSFDPRSPVLTVSGAPFETRIEVVPADDPDPEFTAGLFEPELSGPYFTAVFFELPRLEPHSIGALQHLALGDSGGATDLPYTVGDSSASFRVNAMFDRYFFSTLPRMTNFLDNQFPDLPILDNPRVGVIFRDGNPPDDDNVNGDEVFDPELAAMHLWNEGGFNINSTSVEAWTAVLGGLFGSRLDVYDGGTTTALHQIADRPFARFNQSSGATLTLRSDGTWEQASSYDVNDLDLVDFEFTRGVRELTANEVRSMAYHIVDGIRERVQTSVGRPFTSIAEFLTWTRTSGATVLEEAIFQTFRDFDGQRLNEGHLLNSPMFLTQRDIMASVGGTWTVRSDTFRIRAYGSQVNPVTGAVEGRAWCEAIVQRMPDPVMPAGGTPSANDMITPPTPLGRKFEIISFRWLNADEI